MVFNPFTEEHELFRQQVRNFAEKELAPHADAWEEAELFPNEVFKWAGDRGILGAHFSEEFGGGGGDFWMSIVKAEELPRNNSAGVTMGLLVQSDMATPVIHDIGTREQKEEFLRPAIAGDRIAALGVSEPGAGSDVAGLRTTARLVGDEYIINGSKTYITNGTRASFVTCMVKTNPEAGARGISIILVPTDVAGYSVSRKLKKAGNWASDTAELFFEDVRVPKRYLLGQEGMGFIYLMQNFQSERLVGCASAIAGSKLALDRSVAWGRERQAFGKPLIKREFWQQKFVELYTKLEAAKALTYKAVDAYNDEKYVKKTMLSMETTKLVSMAKAYVGDVNGEIMDQCVQFHGGMGYLEDLWVARAWRDSRLLRIGGGATEVMRYTTAKIMGL
ncbi:MAG: acyl-CoA dehydrogenase family protein [Sandaracinaceae bacterium]|jgi:citronellyl-CoA dehydrogenase|nr:acyl-CoA dehydrogenase family protein [Sandaracinaceae bacterium]MBP7682299.1 acyl-CoA dehydrogenase family protein [Deltaproteobacteria bacterium]MBK6807752.1 acyl-CoA dehydrogenase family protein [Sandaracinaceae bacterium]MBK7154124.1 acyl-CoA dehydrogenase family protein [Sandaracinaceae bacterium]MBK7776269.1 acyl-CoA dehydrogenase family protein [Sandaracinaceae bacterium]